MDSHTYIRIIGLLACPLGDRVIRMDIDIAETGQSYILLAAHAACTSSPYGCEEVPRYSALRPLDRHL
jgi:hypothetical protein